jgi:hypothetical protein
MHKHAEQKRTAILDEIRQIERMRQGTISEQYYGTGENRQGPYYVLQGYAEGKHWSKRVPKAQIEQVKADLEAGVHFKDLCNEFAQITEKATIMEDHPAAKKNAAKRSRNATARAKHS